ncbi:MAG TPA: plastocyanin/azurin family copper-binding protein [Gaiellaceae bacterium]|nr:plastocyanin/azurin family copper-binding protein [Gaiellaceae bacterium]
MGAVPRRVALAASLALVLVAAGCGDNESSEPVATTEVSMAKSYVFEPKAVAIDAGQAVTWTNDDNFTHTVQVDGQDDHKVDQGESVSIEFDTPGTYHYVCTLHENDMDGEVIVR